MTIYNKTEIKIVSAPCGRGKTYALGADIKKKQFQGNHLVLLPSLKLVNHVKEEFESKHGIQGIKVITSETSKQVRKDALEYFKMSQDIGHVVLMTQQGYQDLPYFQHKENWNLYVDEIPQIDEFFPFAVPYNKKYIMDFVEIGDSVNEILAEVKIKDGYEKKLRKLVDRPLDDVNELFRGFYQALLSETKDVFVDLESWYRVFEREEIDERHHQIKDKNYKNRVFFLSMANPADWNGVTLMGANIEQSMLYQWFTQYHGVSFKDNEDIHRNLREDDSVVPLGDRMNVSYFLNNRGFSKYYGKKVLDDGVNTVLSAMDTAVLKEYAGKDVLYVCNNDYSSDVFEGKKNIHKIPVISHGLNSYSEYTNIYFSAALNREPMHIRMLNSLGFSSDLIRTATAHEVMYQCVMRTALRDPESNIMVNVIVPDEYSANRLIEIFGGGNKKRIGDVKGFKKVKPLTQTERSQRSRFNQKMEGMFNKGTVNLSARADQTASIQKTRTSPSGSPLNISLNQEDKTLNNAINLQDTLYKEKCSKNEYLLNLPLTEVLLVTFHKDKFNLELSDFNVEPRAPLHFVSLMKEASKRKIGEKEEVFMVNPAVFDNSINPEGFRLKENFIQSSLIILDFDNGDVTPEDFERIFWHEAGRANKRSFIICNSFSRSEEKPNNFRVFLFYQKPAISIKEHEAVYDSIVQRLEVNGFKVADSGLDNASRTANQSYFIPCTNREYPEYAFFRKYGLGRTADIEKYGINPANYSRTAVIPFEKPRVYAESHTDIDVTERINEIKGEVMKLQKDRRQPHYEMALKLNTLGLPYGEIEYHLNEVQMNIGKSSENWTIEAIKSLKRKKLKRA